MARTWQDEVSAAEADRDVAQDLLAASEVRERKLREDLKKLKAERNLAITERDTEAAACDDARRRLTTVQSDLETVRAENRTKDATIGAVKADAIALEAERDAARAERDLVRSDIRSAREEAESARRVAESAKAEAESAKESAITAVDRFKASTDYRAEVAKASQFFFITGFGECKKDVAAAYPDIDLSVIPDPIVQEEEGSAEGEETETDSEEGQISEPIPTGQTSSSDRLPTEGISTEPAAEGITDLTELDTGAPAAGPEPIVVDQSEAAIEEMVVELQSVGPPQEPAAGQEAPAAEQEAPEAESGGGTGVLGLPIDV